MGDEIEGISSNVCSTCLSADRDLMLINNSPIVYRIFKLLLFGKAFEKLAEVQNEIPTYVCWVCLSLLKKFGRFKKQVQNAQAHLRIIALSTTAEGVGHTYLTQTLSNLEVSSKMEYDKVFNYTGEVDWDEEIMMANKRIKVESPDVAEDSLSQAPSTSHIYITDVDTFMPEEASDDNSYIKSEHKYSTVQLELTSEEPVNLKAKKQLYQRPVQPKSSYTKEYMSEEELLARREDMKLSATYTNMVHKCELCIRGFKSQPQLQQHFVSQHKSKPGLKACKVCFCYMDENKIAKHQTKHYLRYRCKLCKIIKYNINLILIHVKSHLEQNVPNSEQEVHGHKKTQQNSVSQPKPSSKKTVEAYQCSQCDVIFKNVHNRNNHVIRCHREHSVQCDICKNRYVNKASLIAHLKLHEAPPPRTECPTCHKKVGVHYIKKHMQRHNEIGKYECRKCEKVFTHISTYEDHLKFAKAHAGEDLYKFSCPICNKKYKRQGEMKDHVNYIHLEKTEHKCPICDKPMATRYSLARHIKRIHGVKNVQQRNHVCEQCGKAYVMKKSLDEHERIHTGERPLSCDICHHTFKQSAALYTHKRLVHKVPKKRVVEFVEGKSEVTEKRRRVLVTSKT